MHQQRESKHSPPPGVRDSRPAAARDARPVKGESTNQMAGLDTGLHKDPGRRDWELDDRGSRPSTHFSTRDGGTAAIALQTPGCSPRRLRRLCPCPGQLLTRSVPALSMKSRCSTSLLQLRVDTLAQHFDHGVGRDIGQREQALRCVIRARSSFVGCGTSSAILWA